MQPFSSVVHDFRSRVTRASSTSWGMPSRPLPQPLRASETFAARAAVGARHDHPLLAQARRKQQTGQPAVLLHSCRAERHREIVENGDFLSRARSR